ncbi:hypothetical protein L596_030339 [Steinernema carpocapsae]|uniref:Uncharacterized protein n=1 Tax=Steinernema carpocapsae TaxID=34508 RepID=A0A4U5LP54_STECR|nr:hypothetical protein L596_030338 [Steinernema carpocapsae]TKR57665.1 hypothetical protein L596_030339 [Steinernema carpocapsae]
MHISVLLQVLLRSYCSSQNRRNVFIWLFGIVKTEKEGRFLLGLFIRPDHQSHLGKVALVVVHSIGPQLSQ